MFSKNAQSPPQIPLKEFLERIIDERDNQYNRRFSDAEKAVNAALTAAKEAVIKAELAAEKRFESVNEFRSTLSDQQRTLMPRSEAELLIKTLTDKIDTNTANLTMVAGQKSGAQNLFGYIVGAAGIALALVFHFIH